MEESVKTQLLSLSFVKELQDEVMRLENLLTETKKIEPSTCWFDSSSCVYGNPEGQFKLRPTTFCHCGESGCHKIRNEDLIGEVFESFGGRGETILSEWRSENTSVPISEALSNLCSEKSKSEELVFEEDERITISSVVLLLEKHPKLNKNIFFEEDMD